MRSQTLLAGLGDSSFKQLPCASVCLSHEHPAPCSCSSAQVGSRTKILQISCGRTAAFALVTSSTTADSSTDNDVSRLLEWGTGLYGEKLSLPATPLTKRTPGASTSKAVGDETLGPGHPVHVFSPLVAAEVVRFVACGAHFVVASVANGGCITWGGDGEREPRTLGRGGCGINSCQSCQAPYLCNPCSASSQPADSSTTATRGAKPGWVAPPLGPRGLVVTALAAGDDHTIAASADGRVWAWGRGDCGQLGSRPPLDHSTGSCVPTMVEMPLLRNVAFAGLGAGGETKPAEVVVQAVACGRDHSAILAENGRLWTFGSGLYGQLGLGTVGSRAWVPTAVDALDGVGTMRPDGSFTGIASVACGAWHTAALSTTGDVYAWGWARFGALGSMPRDALGPVGQNVRGCEAQDGDDAGAGGERRKRKLGKTVVTEGEGAEVRPYPGLVDGLESLLSEDDRITSLSCGARYTLALSLKKRAYVWGQVAPYSDGDGGGGSDRRCNGSGGSDPTAFARPRQLHPAELLRAAREAESCEKERCCCCNYSRPGEDAGVPVDGGDEERRRGVEGEDPSRWSVSAAGCGPWYVILGLQEEREQF